jgi:hypothetical protein
MTGFAPGLHRLCTGFASNQPRQEVIRPLRRGRLVEGIEENVRRNSLSTCHSGSRTNSSQFANAANHDHFSGEGSHLEICQGAIISSFVSNQLQKSTQLCLGVAGFFT